MLRANRGGRESGQALVLVALFFSGLLAFAALAVDVGRFMAERRYLQNAADAAALAGASVLVNGGTTADAEAAARAALTANFASDPTGTTPAQPPLLPVYEDGHAGKPEHLAEGVLATTSGVRVALRNPITYTFGRVVGALSQDVGARAYAGYSGNLLPIAVRRYVNAPGPNSGAVTPCPNDQSRFMAFFATADTACLGTDSDASLRVAPSAGMPFDPLNPNSDTANHGPIVTILGQGAQPSNSSDFRGFIALDIRNFSTTISRQFYNGATSGMTSNELKNLEVSWIASLGYPGPGFPSVTTPPDPNHQVGIMSGNSTGAAIDEVMRRFAPGDTILVAVYPGTVMTIPDFVVSPPGTISLPTTGTVADAGSFKVSRNQSFTGTVELGTRADTLDAANPMVTGALIGTEPFTYNPNPVSPGMGGGTAVGMGNVTTSGATPGIYTLWIRGFSGSPYLTEKFEPFALKIGTVTRDFSMTADAGTKSTPTTGGTVSFTLTLSNSPNSNTNFGGPVSLSVDGPTPSGVGAISFGSTSVTPSKNGTSTTLTINTGTLPQGSYRFVVRATGMNGDTTSRKVTHLLPLRVDVAPSASGGTDTYIDITGFAAMRLVEMNSNYITAYAITGAKADPNDPELRRALKVRLLPW